MTNNDPTTRPYDDTSSLPTYEAPHLTIVGDATTVVRGIAGAGDDLFGYSVPDFEFQPDDQDRSGDL